MFIFSYRAIATTQRDEQEI